MAPPGWEGAREQSRVRPRGPRDSAVTENEDDTVGAARRGPALSSPRPAPLRGPRSKVWSRGRRAPVPPRSDPLAESLLPPLPGQDKGSLTRDGTTLHKWDWSESEPETARKRRERQGPRTGRGDRRSGWPRRAAPRRPARSTGRQGDPGNDPGLPEPRGDSPGDCGARVLEAGDAGAQTD